MLRETSKARTISRPRRESATIHKPHPHPAKTTITSPRKKRKKMSDMIILKRSSLKNGSRLLEGAAAANKAAFSLFFIYLTMTTGIKAAGIINKKRKTELSKLKEGPPAHNALQNAPPKAAPPQLLQKQRKEVLPFLREWICV
jgi:hypothetical protein